MTEQRRPKNEGTSQVPEVEREGNQGAADGLHATMALEHKYLPDINWGSYTASCLKIYDIWALRAP